MIWLWIAAAVLSAGAAALIVRRSALGVRGTPAGPEVGVYRRQMAEIDQLADRGLLAEAERRSIRAETGRRLLAAAGRSEAPLRAASPAVVIALAAIVPLAGAAAYLAIGNAGYADQPFAARLAAWRGQDPQTLTAPQMAAVLREIAAERPQDPEPLRNLALAELASDQPTEAAQALQRAIALAPARADLWAALGQADVAASNGEASADSAAAFHHALALDPTNADARYFLARARIAGGDTAGGLADWRALSAGLPTGDPRKVALDAEIAAVTATGALPTAAPAQTASADQAGAPVVGAAQIQAMVDGLAARLKAAPNDSDGWVRLVRAYSVLGETARRDAALAEAQRRFAGKPDVLAALAAAARAPT